MERSKTEDIGSVLRRLLRQQGLESPLNEHRLVAAWPDVAGTIAARHTRECYIRSEKLFVRLDSAVVRAELQMRRTDLTRRLNARVGANVITDIVLI